MPKIYIHSRKMLMWICATLLLIGIIPIKPIQVLATPANVQISIPSVQGTVGQQVDIPVSVALPYSGIAAYGLQIDYDHNVLEALSVTPSYGNASETQCLEDQQGCFQSAIHSELGWLRAGWVDISGGDRPIVSAKELFVIRFTIKSAIVSGSNLLSVDSSNPEKLNMTDASGADMHALVKIERSGLADLKALTTSTGDLSPSFTPGTFSYRQDVRNGVKQTSITAVVYDPQATIMINGAPAVSGVPSSPISLLTGDNSIPVVVKAANSSYTNTYTIIINRAVASSDSSSTDVSHPTGGTPTSLEGLGTSSTEKVGDRTVTTITLDQDKMSSKLEKESGKVITIPAGNSEVVSIQLTGQMVKMMETKDFVLEIQTDRASYRIPAAQIQITDISSKLGINVSLQDIIVDVKIALPSKETLDTVQKTAADNGIKIAVPPVNFEISAALGDKKVDVSRFNNYVERMIALPDGVDASQITTGVVLNSDGSLTHVPTKIITKDGHDYAVINSLTNSTYTVIWHPLEFKDVANHWAKDAVNLMGSRMVIGGVGNDMFNPNQDITRAEFAAIMVRGLGLKLESGSTPFADVKAADWYNGAIQTAYAYKLINGVEDGTFHPQDKITREQAVVIIAKAMNITGLKAKLTTKAEVLSSFVDANSVSEWAKSSMSDSLQAGIVSGRNSTELAPKAYITRAEVAAIVQRLLKKSDLI